MMRAIRAGVLLATLIVASGELAAQQRDSRSSDTPPPGSIENMLVANWQPGFCATEAGESKKECRTQTADRFDATHFSLHGLWPDDLDNRDIFPCYCNLPTPIRCNESSRDERRISLSPDVRNRLQEVMPAVRSNLHLHEWSKHGTCYERDLKGADAGSDPDEFFSEAMALLAQLNQSPVRDLFVAHLGHDLTAKEIEAAFDSAFGKGTGRKVVVRCDRDTGVITELWIGLKGEITTESDLGALIRAAPPSNRFTGARSCDGAVARVHAN